MTEKEAVNLYTYLRDCYRQDYKEFKVDNILSPKYPYKWFVKTEESLLNEFLSQQEYDNKKSEELEKELELYQLEKKLFYGCFFLLGTSENHFIKDKRVCAPLVLFPANLIFENTTYFIKIDREKPIINSSVLSRLELTDNNLSKDLFIEELNKKIGSTFDNQIWLKNLLDKYFGNQNSDELLEYPTTWSTTKLINYFKNNILTTGEYIIVPAAGTVIVSKSVSSLHVLTDLKEMALKGNFNTSLKAIMEGESSSLIFEDSFFKPRLNKGQFQALKNSHLYHNSVIIGPPGTGKSYTITSIVADYVSKGKNVLVVSKKKQAVEVIRHMLHQDFGLKNYCIHTSSSKYKISLKSKVQKYLTGIFAKPRAYWKEESIINEYNLLIEAENEFKKGVEKELKISDLSFKDSFNLLEQLEKVFLNFTLNFDPKLWETFSKITNHTKALDKQLKIYIQEKIKNWIQSNTSIYREDIAIYLDALESDSFTEYKNTLNKIDYKNILKIFPIWLADLSNLNTVLPLEKDLFDLVIIDEATQCDIASALPAIYRAKKVVIAGDPNQLKHYSFVSKKQQNDLQKKHNLKKDKILDYRNRSILDVYINKIKKQEQISFLREHFRSTPSLIEFSNVTFYENQLEIIKSTPKHLVSNQIELINVNGIRNKQGINEIEAEAVINKLTEIINSYDMLNIKTSIGIISPFSSQVNFINKKIKEKFDLTSIKKYDILCGTPYNFQGSEREIILISFCVCDNSHHSAFIHANQPEVLNVGITRAKSFQYVYKSVKGKNMNPNSLLAQYFTFIENYKSIPKNNSETDIFQREVVQALKTKKINDIICGYPVAGSILDILITHKDKLYFIDLIGYPGNFKEAFTIERYKTLARTGIHSFPLHYTFWKKNKNEALSALIRFLK